MPLSGSEGNIIGRAQAFAKHGVLLGDRLALAVDMEQRPSGVQHRAAGHADCATGPARESECSPDDQCEEGTVSVSSQPANSA